MSGPMLSELKDAEQITWSNSTYLIDLKTAVTRLACNALINFVYREGLLCVNRVAGRFEAMIYVPRG